MTIILLPTLVSCQKGYSSEEPKSQDSEETSETSISVSDEEKHIVKKSVLIGGGWPTGTTEKILQLSETENPKVRIFATAMNDDKANEDNYISMFSPYSTDVKAIELINPTLTNEEIELDILSSNIICVAGGMTEVLMREWKEHRLDFALTEAYKRGTVMCGGSAGAICWTYSGFNDFNSGAMDFIKGINIIPIWFGPHASDTEEVAWNQFGAVLNTKSEQQNNGAPKVGFLLTNDSALVFEDNHYSLIKEKNASIHRYNYRDNEWIINDIGYTSGTIDYEI